MSDFKDIAHKTVAELFDMLKEKQYTVDALSEISHEKDLEIADLKAQLNNMEQCYIEKKKELEGQQKRIDEVLQEVKGLERFTGEDCIADFDVLRGAVSHACKRLEKTLRGDNA